MDPMAKALDLLRAVERQRRAARALGGPVAITLRRLSRRYLIQAMKILAEHPPRPPPGDP